MSTINDGGPAFSGSYEEFDCDNDRWRVVSSGGMTLRDYFAGQALHNMLGGGHKPNYDIAASDAYLYADAMIKAREA
jgi:hypothetical protein